MGAFWDLIDQHLQKMEFPPSKRRLALRLGVAPQTITNWQTSVTDLPKRENLEAVADFVGRPYSEVLEAALSETGYGPGRARKRRSSDLDDTMGEAALETEPGLDEEPGGSDPNE